MTCKISGGGFYSCFKKPVIELHGNEKSSVSFGRKHTYCLTNILLCCHRDNDYAQKKPFKRHFMNNSGQLHNQRLGRKVKKPKNVDYAGR